MTDYYYDETTELTPTQSMGRTLYKDVLGDRRGFRPDQLGIDEEDTVWLEIFDALGEAILDAEIPMEDDVFSAYVRSKKNLHNNWRVSKWESLGDGVLLTGALARPMTKQEAQIQGGYVGKQTWFTPHLGEEKLLLTMEDYTYLCNKKWYLEDKRKNA